MEGMGTMNISLPESMKDFIDAQVVDRGFGTSSEYVRELIRREQERCRLRDKLLDGANSGVGEAAAPAYFDALRSRIRQRRDE
jgi:antitoxin ParD1/3/4